MNGLVKREIAKLISSRLKTYPAVAILGARQVGKSTLAKELLKKFPTSIYLDLELPKDLNKLKDPEAFFDLNNGKLICLDEIQRTPEIFPILRGHIDKTRKSGQFLILGSASRDLIKQSSETLAGRISYIELTPFTRSEIGSISKKGDIRKHWFKGGLPASFLARSNKDSHQWRIDYIRSFLERDIPQLGFNIPANTLSRFWRMLAHVHSETLNSSKLGDSLGTSSVTIRKYIDLLEQTFLVRTLPPYEANVKKRLIKAPKVYIRDSGLLHSLLEIETQNDLLGHPIYGDSWEGFCIEQILSILPDWQGFFYRTSNKAEIDLIMTKGQKKIAIELKASTSPKLSKGFFNARDDISPNSSYVVAPVDAPYPYDKKTMVMDLDSLLLKLQKM